MWSEPPPRVKPGDTVAIVSPSFGAPGRWPHRAGRGRAYLESLGFEVRMMRNAERDDSWVSATPEERADDIHEAFADDSVTVVLSSIGGNHSNQVLPHLDFELIASHPKIRRHLNSSLRRGKSGSVRSARARRTARR